MDLRDVQSRLTAAHLYDGNVDGLLGDLTKAALKAFLLQQGVDGFEMWSPARRLVAAQQLICRIDGIETGRIDGLAGAQTKYAIAVWDARQASGGKPVAAVEAWRDDASAAPATPSRALPQITSSQVAAPATRPVWPKQSAMDSFYGPKGTGQVSLVLPYKMRLAWDLSSGVSRFSCHGKVRENLERILVRTLDHYGLEQIQKLRLDLFGGCLNVRKMRGGSSWSIHSWGCAVDIDPDHNQLKMSRRQASLDNPEYDPFWSFVYDEGAIGLGRERDYDWMHFQFARI
ncbi:M15 family metallopeptidase [Bradyrhizobium yuanmingense]|uniref:M15 family metallopeptidase n=1 Tax=Bradyrhizobium yuanmingense TaxID=108015 RepID=UPI0004B865DA|nr:M15 family metallopeptidase [Bradyrhizobium yuanmingense]